MIMFVIIVNGCFPMIILLCVSVYKGNTEILYRVTALLCSRNTGTMKVQFTPGVALHCLHLTRCLRTLCVFNQSDKDSKKDSSNLLIIS